jgi:hypothetical protein
VLLSWLASRSTRDALAAIESRLLAGLGLNCGAGPEGTLGPARGLAPACALVSVPSERRTPRPERALSVRPDAFARIVAAYCRRRPGGHHRRLLRHDPRARCGSRACRATMRAWNT